MCIMCHGMHYASWRQAQTARGNAAVSTAARQHRAGGEGGGQPFAALPHSPSHLTSAGISYLESTSAPDCSKTRASATSPLLVVSCRASFRQLFPTPHSTKTFTASLWPCLVARTKGVLPRESMRSIMADVASRAEMTCAWPAIADTCKGVR